jgi:signal peptidase I
MENINYASALNQTKIETKSKLREYIEAILWAFFLYLTVQTCLVQSFKIPSGSMENTLLIGDYLMVNKFLYGIRVPFTNYRLPAIKEPERGDVIVFKYPEDTSVDFIKRVIGVPGDEIQIINKEVYINGILYKNPHEIHKDKQIFPAELVARDNFGPIRVPEGSYFVMGDNRDNSHDSRFWGFVPKSNLVGKAMIKYWSWDKNELHVRWERICRIIE